MTYDVLLTKRDKKFIARVRNWPEVTVEGDSEAEVLLKAQADLRSLLTNGRIVQLELDVQPAEHPWQGLVGMFADDPDWDKFQESIRQYRAEIDKTFVEE